jgi:pimeloyl-ACP methyl ester carboxylesterase
MVRSKKIAGLVLAAGLAAGGLTAGAAGAASASSSSCGGSGSVTTVNGTLYLYSHGYVAPGSANPAQDVGDPVTAAWMLGHGYALAGSSYASTGWAIAQALPDQINTLDAFGGLYGQPRTTVAWGHSLGGIITAGLLQDYPKRFNAALPMCGVLAGGVATWNTALDAEFAFQKLIDPAVQTVNSPTPRPTCRPPRSRGLRPRRPRRAGLASPWSRRSATRPAGSPRCPPNPPPPTTPPRKRTSSCGVRR